VPDEARIQDLLELILDTDSSPEQVSDGNHELEQLLRERLRRAREIEAQMEALFPTPHDRGPPARRALLESLRQDRQLPDIPGYEVHSVIGTGGMGVVYRARHLKLNRWVAIKMVLLGAYASREELECLLREAQDVAALRHPNIVQVYDVGEHDGFPYFAMELLEGGDLAQTLRGKPLAARESAELIRVLADAVHAAHLGGIVHRDLKPGNILLDSNDTPKIGDFSLASRLNRGQTILIRSRRGGTPSYMAPEQATCDMNSIGPAVDIYALGAVLYELLTGRPPFKAETASETQRQLLNNELVSPSRLNSRVPRDLETICLKCLQKDPSRRYASAEALSDDLARYLQGEPIAARPISRFERCGRYVRRNPRDSILIAILMILCGFIAVASVREWNRKVEQRAELSMWNDRLAYVIQMENEGRFGEGRALLARLPDIGSIALRANIRNAMRDLGTVEQLDSIRMSRGLFKQGGGIDYSDAANRYEIAFGNDGLGSLREDPLLVAERLRESPVRVALVAAMDDWAACAGAEDRAWILAVAKALDPDPWRDRVRDQDRWADVDELERIAADADVTTQPVNLMVAMGTRWRRLGGDPLAFLLRVQREHPDDFWVNFELSHLLGSVDPDAAIGFARAALAVRPNASVVHYNLGIHTFLAGQSEIAIDHLQRTIAADPNHTWAYELLGKLYYDRGDLAQSEASYKAALRLDPTNTSAWLALRFVFLSEGRCEDLARFWMEQLVQESSTPEEWNGFAELCLYLGNNAEYEHACDELLERFGDSSDPHTCERIGRALLLAPVSGERLARATELIDRALNADPGTYSNWAPPYFRLARALAEFRAGRFETCIATLDSETDVALPPMPYLLKAMSLQQSGRDDEAYRLLTETIQAYDWSEDRATNPEEWIFHILRREAEQSVFLISNE